MCGLTGFFGGVAGVGGDETIRQGAGQALLRCMANTLIHRGPDDGGVWCDSEQRIGLGHRRLAIVDLSPAGHQPMVSASGRFVIAFNGEVYNHLELRTELEQIPPDGTTSHSTRPSEYDSQVAGYSPPFAKGVQEDFPHPNPPPVGEGAIRWRGHSDTETLLAGIEAWGVEATLKKSIGMFAIALWDRQTCTLTLARDRIGEKPLYYGWQGSVNEQVFLFGSELKALRAHPAFAAEIDRGALCLLLRHN